MKILLIEDKDKLGDAIAALKPFGEVVLWDWKKKITEYKKIFESDEPKVVGVSPGVTEWKFPLGIIKSIKNLKGICTKSAWAFYIDVEYCKQNGVIVCNTPAANSQSVAEYAIWMMLSLARKLPLQMEEGFKKATDKNHLQTEISGKKIGVVGLGNIGSRIAQMGKGMGMEVVYWSPKSRSKKYEYADLDRLLKTSDFIFNCIEAMESTKNFFDKNKLSLLNKNSHFISVMGGMGWGPEDNDYLVKMLNEDKLAGLAIENEHDHGYRVPRVKKGKNIFLPGAFAWYTKEAVQRTEEKWTESIVGIAKGKPVNVVK